MASWLPHELPQYINNSNNINNNNNWRVYYALVIAQFRVQYDQYFPSFSNFPAKYK